MGHTKKLLANHINKVTLFFILAIFCMGCDKQPMEQEAELAAPPQPLVIPENVYTQKVKDTDPKRVAYTVKYTVTHNLRIVEFVHPRPFAAIVMEQFDEHRSDNKLGVHQSFTDGEHPVQFEMFYLRLLGRNRFCIGRAEKDVYYDVETRETLTNLKPTEIVPITASKVEDKRQSDEYRQAKALCEKYPALGGVINWEKKNEDKKG